MQPHFNPVAELAEFAPVELAARARLREGFAFFDSARDMGASEPMSMLAIEPECWLEGDLFAPADFERLRRTVSQLSKEAAPLGDGVTGPILGGAIGYDGCYCFGLYRHVLVYRHREGAWYASSNWWQSLLAGAPPVARLNGALRFRPVLEGEAFCARVRRAQAYISSGDIYQVNLSYPFEAAWPGGETWAFYEALRRCSPAPYGAFVQQPKRSILSTSPELFLKFSGRNVQTRPIKGTRPRHSEISADEQNARELLTSPKEIAELVMITDLERNDLGQFCEWGSVRVSELLKLERHEQVFHLVSTVEGRMREDVDVVSALRECFPGGSITGAPKRRAREIIKELEGQDRGLYTGALGWFGANGESVFNILIRTVVVEGGQAHFHVGAGVVADSIPKAEWQETRDKATGILWASESVAKKKPNAGAASGSSIATPAEQC